MVKVSNENVTVSHIIQRSDGIAVLVQSLVLGVWVVGTVFKDGII
jgi:hypothetical protein